MLDEEVDDVEGAAERRHVHRSRVHDKGAVIRAAVQQSLDHPHRGHLPGARLALVHRPRVQVSSTPTLRGGVESFVFVESRVVLGGVVAFVRVSPLCAFFGILRHPSLRRLVDVRGDGEVQRRVVQPLSGDVRSPERLRRRGSSALHLLRVGVFRSAVRVRASRDEHLDHGGVHARGGGVHRAVPEPSPDDAG